MDQEIEQVEKKIKQKIDAIFDSAISDYRFVRSSPEEVQQDSGNTAAKELVGRLQSLAESLVKERQELKTLMDRLPNHEDLQDANPEEVGLQILGNAQEIKQVGKNVGPILDRLLLLTQQLLKNAPNR
jgi:hypothetical protein